MSVDDDIRSAALLGNPVFWQVTERDAGGHPTALRPVLAAQMHAVHDAGGEVLGYAMGTHPAYGPLSVEDVLYRPMARAEEDRRSAATLADAIAAGFHVPPPHADTPGTGFPI